MELKINANCQLILDGEKPESGLEVIVYGDNIEVVARKEDETNYWKFDMPEDGYYEYYVLQFDIEPEDILDHIRKYGAEPQGFIFSICKLRNCLLQKEKEYISKFLHGCNHSGNCSKSDEESLERDFLLSTIFVLEHLICIGNVEDATRILNNLKSCTVCSNDKINNSCGCNGKNR